MKVILLDKIARLGNVGSEVEVKAGYARNYLLPKGLALLATKAARAEFEAKRAELEKQAAEKLQAAKDLAAKVEAIGTVEVSVQAGHDGRLFGSVTNRDVVEILKAYDIEVSKSAVRLPNGVIREAGETVVRLHLHSDVNVDLPLHVIAN